MEWATWATERGVGGASEVVEYLRMLAPELPVQAANPAPGRASGVAEILQELAPETPEQAANPAPGRPLCEPGVSHPPGRKRRGPRVNWMFQAAAEGCMTCVHHYVLVAKMDPLAQSENIKYKALDWATWAA